MKWSEKNCTKCSSRVCLLGAMRNEGQHNAATDNMWRLLLLLLLLYALCTPLSGFLRLLPGPTGTHAVCAFFRSPYACLAICHKPQTNDAQLLSPRRSMLEISLAVPVCVSVSDLILPQYTHPQVQHRRQTPHSIKVVAIT